MAGKSLMMSRIPEALGSHAQNLEELSLRTDIPIERLRGLSGGADPSMLEVRKLAAALKLSVADMAPMPKEARQADLLFRATAKMKNLPADTLVETLSRKMGYSLELLQRAPNRIPSWIREFSELPKNNPEVLALHFRQLFCNGDQVSPLLLLPTLLVERLQIMLFVINTPFIDGASAYLSGIPFIFVAARFPARMLFTCAHELGHVLAHLDPQKDFAMIDSDSEIRHSKSSTERFAHAFASAVLIPRAGLGIVLKKVREFSGLPSDSPIGDVELLYVSRIFGVSFEVAARRCEDVDLLPRGAAASLNEKLKAEYGSAEKRADLLNLPPRTSVSFPPLPPELLTSVIEKIRHGELSLGRASMMLDLSIGDLLSANVSQTQ